MHGLWIALALVATPAMAQAPDAALARAEQMGRLIYDHDQAAWHATDEMRRQVASSPASGGWVVEPRDGLLRVIFYDDTSGAARAFFWADMRGKAVVASHRVTPEEDARLTPRQTRLVQAGAAARAERKTPCTDAPFNTVIVPPENDAGPVTVYQLTPMTSSGVYPLGGHYRVDVGADGRITGGRDFTKACFNLNMAGAPPGGIPGVTHLMDPRPTEIHVFLSLWMGRPLYVMTGEDSVWIVDQGRIGRGK
ncbi:hypothetical protein [Phenylobacterium sp.]|uniref:hypothetical protein n=1 Tax=Phenylobacterium sp. TaxID=1871053 RepID=UPI0030F38F0E